MKQLELTVTGPETFMEAWVKEWPTISAVLDSVREMYRSMAVVGDDPYREYDVWSHGDAHELTLALHLGRDFLSKEILDASLNFGRCQEAINGPAFLRVKAIFDEHAEQFRPCLKKMPDTVLEAVTGRAKKIFESYTASTVKLISFVKCCSEARSVIEKPITRGLRVENLSSDLFLPEVVVDNLWMQRISGQDPTGIYSPKLLSEKDIRVYEAAGLSILSAVCVRRKRRR